MYLRISRCSSFSRMALVLSELSRSTASDLCGHKCGQPPQLCLQELTPLHVGLPEPLFAFHLLGCEAEEVSGELEVRGQG